MGGGLGGEVLKIPTYPLSRKEKKRRTRTFLVPAKGLRMFPHEKRVGCYWKQTASRKEKKGGNISRFPFPHFHLFPFFNTRPDLRRGGTAKGRLKR